VNRIKKLIGYGTILGLAAGLVFASLIAYANAKAKPLVIQSAVMDEPRAVRVFLPANYNEKGLQKYTVLYTLDGERIRNGALAALTARIAAPDGIILVAIDAQGMRVRDMLLDGATQNGQAHSGQASRLLNFIEHELIPKIEAKFPTNGRRIIAGHSLAGLFTVYAMTQKPSLFDGYFAFSPTFSHADGSVGKLTKSLKDNPSLDGFLYMNLGLETEHGYRDLFMEAEAALDNNAPANLRHKVSYYVLPHPLIMIPGYAEALNGFFADCSSPKSRNHHSIASVDATGRS